MPILNDSAPLYSPSSDYAIVKYLDLTKFISILHKQSLFFCRLDMLEDQFEGTTSNANFDFRVKWYKCFRDSGQSEDIMTDDEIIDQVKSEFELEKKNKETVCVNCWNKKTEESAALWKIYSDFSKGIMIQSSISKLTNSLKATTEKIRLSEIYYLNYSKDIMPDGNIMLPYIHKQKAYSYEDEVRLIYETKINGFNHDWSKEEVKEGIYIKTNLNELIDEIVIGPYSPKWFYELVKDISIKFGLNKPIRNSEFSING